MMSPGAIMNIYMDGKNVGWLLYLAMGFVALGIAFYCPIKSLQC